MGGTALGQGVNTGKFTAASITGSNYVFGAQGSDTHGTLQLAGLLTTAAQRCRDRNVQLERPHQYSRSRRLPLPAPTPSILLAASPSPNSSAQPSATRSISISPETAMGSLLSNDTADIFNGQAFQQQAAPFTAASLSGTYGLTDSTSVTARNSGALQASIANGSIVATPGSSATTIAGYADLGNGSNNFALSGSLTPSSTGIFEGTVAGFNPAARTTAANFTLYLVDLTQGVLIETDAAQLNLGHLQLQ